MPPDIASYLKRLALSRTRNPFVQVSATWDPSGPRIPMAVYSSGVNMAVVENVQLKFQKLDNMNYYIWVAMPGWGLCNGNEGFFHTAQIGVGTITPGGFVLAPAPSNAKPLLMK